MDDLACWVLGWGVEGNIRLASRLRERVKVPHVFAHTDFSRSEAQNGNMVIDYSERHGFQYIMIVDSDVEFPYDETVPKMYEFLTSNYYPNIGSVRPWRKGEPAQSAHYPPEKKYVDDATAIMFRLGTGVRFDEEFAFTGWSDLDLGQTIERFGYDNYNDRRYPVFHNMDGSNRHSQSTIVQAIKKANKLLLDFKWHKVGIDRWSGVEDYNLGVPIEERIPTINQLVYYSNEQQEMFQQSISPEHHQIWVKDSHENPNLVWKNPVIVGYSTREEFEKTHGYS